MPNPRDRVDDESGGLSALSFTALSASAAIVDGREGEEGKGLDDWQRNTNRKKSKRQGAKQNQGERRAAERADRAEREREWLSCAGKNETKTDSSGQPD